MVKLISVTKGAGELVNKTAQEIIVYTARVSNPSNQMNFETSAKLIKYLIRNKHWSPFEQAFMTVEITTSRAISAQILRHRSFTFQEFSQRYSQATEFEVYEARRQDKSNRQNSIDDISTEDKEWFETVQHKVIGSCEKLYEEALARGIAKEQSRFLLPLSTRTKLYVCGSVRSWIHYILLRTSKETQKEHRDIALQIKDLFEEQFPDIYEALEDK